MHAKKIVLNDFRLPPAAFRIRESRGLGNQVAALISELSRLSLWELKNP